MIGTPLIEIDRVDSTNSYAERALLNQELVEGTVIWAHAQTKGKGQNENAWLSEPGKNLTCTILLTPRFLPPEHQFMINKVISLGCLDFVRSRLREAGDKLTEPSIKWPNDIYLGSRKLGGILITSRVMGPVLETLLAGIGININQELFSPELPNPVSLVQILGKRSDLKESLTILCQCISNRYEKLREGKILTIENDYRASLLGIGEWKNFSSRNEIIRGRISGVDEFGRLQIENIHSEFFTYNHREIEMLFEKEATP